MRTFRGVRQFNNIVHNAEPVDLQRTMGFSFSIHLVIRRLRLIVEFLFESKNLIIDRLGTEWASCFC